MFLRDRHFVLLPETPDFAQRGLKDVEIECPYVGACCTRIGDDGESATPVPRDQCGEKRIIPRVDHCFAYEDASTVPGAGEDTRNL